MLAVREPKLPQVSYVSQRLSRNALATPDGWTYDDSLSANFKFVENGESEKLKFLRHEDGTDVYLDLSRGKEVYVGRSKATNLF